MGYEYWPDYTPDSKFGPCIEPCPHVDCAVLRSEDGAHPQCPECGQRLQAGDRYYFRSVGTEHIAVHAKCEETALA